MGKFTPTSRRFLCKFHKGSKTWDSKTRKYKGLYKNNKIELDKKINILKNLINFKTKSRNEIKEYILKEEERAKSIRYRTKYYTRSFNRWNNRLRGSKRQTDQLENFIRLLGQKPKV
jgi:predicted DNA-binding ArsR family transcriptional regulator|tara:strand:+ start:155 stop:505 length:351 start_codon:yes stop_codon:yes gene_type:complete